MFIGVSFNELVWATLYLCQIHITRGTSMLFQQKEIAFCTCVQLECHLTLTALHADFHSNQCTWCTSNFSYRKNFLRYFFHSIYLWISWSALWLKVILLSTLVASLPSGRALAISMLISTKSAFWPVEGRVTWPSGVQRLFSINCTNWLLCSARNQVQLLTGLFWSLEMSIALVKVRSFTCKSRSLIFLILDSKDQVVA